MSKDKVVGFIRIGIMGGLGMIAACAGAAHAQSTDQQANCAEVIGTKTPLKLTYQNGFATTVVERKGREIRSEMIAPSGAKTTFVTYGGLFNLRIVTPGGEVIDYKWDRDVTQFFPLKVGEHITAAATMNVKSGSLNSFSTELTVVASESYRIEACDYPVLKIEFHNRFSQAPNEGDGIRYYHAASMLMLKWVSTTSAFAGFPQHTAEERVVKLE